MFSPSRLLAMLGHGFDLILAILAIFAGLIFLLPPFAVLIAGFCGLVAVSQGLGGLLRWLTGKPRFDWWLFATNSCLTIIYASAAFYLTAPMQHVVTAYL